MLSRRQDDAGFTLVELLIAIVILGIITVPLAAAVLAYLTNSGATAARLSESHDAQIAAAYFAQDVQSLGVRDDYASTATPDFLQSIETNIEPDGGNYPCGPAGTPNAVLRLAWDTFTDPKVSSRSQTRVAYVVQGSELHRLKCEGSPAVTTDVVIAHELVAPFATVTCRSGAGAPISCTGSGAALPSSISLELTIRDPQNRTGTDYTVTLTGQRRQSQP